MSCDPSRWLDDHGDVLYRFALARLRDRTKAEDVVQETLLGALKNAQTFEGRAAERTWLIGILRNKISDTMRKSGRAEERLDEAFFTDRGHWAAPPSEWHDPDSALQSKEFQRQFQDCLGGLPESFAEVFVLREVEGLEYDEICDALAVTATNLSTRLYRARLMLRDCLEKNWFNQR